MAREETGTRNSIAVIYLVMTGGIALTGDIKTHITPFYGKCDTTLYVMRHVGLLRNTKK